MSGVTEEMSAHRSWRRKLLAHSAALLILFAVAIGTWHVVSPQSSPINYLLTPEALPAVPRAHRPETLDPALFTGKVAEAYRVAGQRPALLERLPCYCGCYLTAGHQNNLDCFRDRHGETCDMCLEIALEAERLARAGYGAADIKAIVDRRFAPRKSDATK
jgi:hypothetical protein